MSAMILEKAKELPAASGTRSGKHPAAALLKRITFYSVFLLVFCLSGLLTVVGIRLGISYRMGLVSALVLPLVLLYGIKINRIVLAYAALAGVVFLSGLANHSSLIEVLLFLRTLGFSYLIYRLVEIYVRPDNIVHIIRLCVLVALIQLPIIMLQQLAYGQLPDWLQNNVFLIDFGFGTFNFKGDAPMAFFLTLLVTFLLFDNRRNYIVRFKWPVLFWLTLTIMVANAEGVKLIAMMVWGIYLVTHLKARAIVYSILVALLIITGLWSVGLLDKIWSNFTYNLSTNTQVDLSRQDAFLSGNYARGSAIAYYLSTDILWLGDGPSRYSDVFSRELYRGNTGHIFTFYSEVGLLGWLLSMVVFFLIAFPGRQLRFRKHWVSLLIFAAVLMLSFTTEIMNDVSVVLIYCIIAKSYLIPEKANEPMRSSE
jgi:hypothetical protein